MSWNANEYPPTMAEADRIDREEEEIRAELAAQEEEERDAREEAFGKTGTPWCEIECYQKLAHTVACQAINAPVLAAVDGWRRALNAAQSAPRVIEYVDDSWLRTPSVGQQLARKRRAA